MSINCLKGKVTSGKIMQQQYDRIESLYPEFEAATAANLALAAQALAAARQVIALNGSRSFFRLRFRADPYPHFT